MTTANEVVRFDNRKEHHGDKILIDSILSPRGSNASVFRIGVSAMKDQSIVVSKPERLHSISISMPSSPDVARLSDGKGSYLCDSDTGRKSETLVHSKSAMFIKDKRFDSFKTWSGKLEMPKYSNLRGNSESESLHVERYFDALDGPELDVLRASEEILLPKDEKWPFLLRFPITSFGICLGVSSQAIMWKALSSSNFAPFPRTCPRIHLALWTTSIVLLALISLIYSLKLILYFEAIHREFLHPIRVNFFFAPWITLLFLALGAPHFIFQTLHSSVWYVLMAPIFCLEVKIYGQWMSGGERRLSKVANPSNHLSIIGNFVGALLGASMGLNEGPVFFFAVGLAHYMVLFVTLYQRLPTNKSVPKELHPIFFLFVAAPSIAAMAWAAVLGYFDYGARIAYFNALFLYLSLVVRVNFFIGFRFSLGWWAYTFPVTAFATTTIMYSTVVGNVLTKTLTLFLCVIATLTVAAMVVATMIHAFVIGDLFPNDIAIAISEKPPKLTRKWYRRRTTGSSNSIKRYLKHASSCEKDIESAVNLQQD